MSHISNPEDRLAGQHEALLEFIDEIAPEHDRASCSDERLIRAAHRPDGSPYCVRCAMLYRLNSGEWPEGRQHRVMGLTAVCDCHSKNCYLISCRRCKECGTDRARS